MENERNMKGKMDGNERKLNGKKGNWKEMKGKIDGNERKNGWK